MSLGASTIQSFLIALLAALLTAPLVIPILRRMKFGQQVRDDGPRTHLAKQGTPTMGGVIIVAGLLIAALFARPWSAEWGLMLTATILYGLIGFVDDYRKVVLKRALGLRAREKLAGQIVVALALTLAAYLLSGRDTSIYIPFTQTEMIDLGFWYVPFVGCVFVAAGNAVNLTDGLDGLAAGCTAIAGISFLGIGLVINNLAAASFSAALIGACLGFLWYNRHPARVFMGDTGSLALGAALAALSLVLDCELVLLIIGGVFVLETVSVILQVISYQATGKRIFRMAPLHHHFELQGWHETKVVRVFWLLAGMFALLGYCGWAAR